MKKILVIQTAFIGDVILATNMPDNIKAIFPDALVDVLVRKGNESLFINNPHVNAILVWDKSENKTRNLLKLIAEVRRMRYDAVVNIQRFLSTGLITVLSGAEEIIGFNKNPLSFLFTRSVEHQLDGRHELDRNNELIEHWGKPKLNKPIIYLSDEDILSVEKYKTQPYVCIAPGTEWFTKRFPKEKFVSFIKLLPDSLRVYLLGGPKDKGLCDDIASAVDKENVVSLGGKLNLLQSSALMKDARMNYANDSAPLHLASAVNAPVTAIYCSTVPRFGFWPQSDITHIVETDIHLDCRPCGIHGRRSCPEGHFKCALTIDEKRLAKLAE